MMTMVRIRVLTAALLLFAGDLSVAAENAATDVAAPVFTTSMVAGGDGLPIAVTAGGNPDGPGIVFVHGFLASTLNWQKQMSAELAERYRLVFVDMRGHGSSSKPAAAEHYLNPKLFAEDVAAAIAAEGLDKPLLVGWSYGGFFIMDYLRHYGADSVTGVVLSGTTAGLLPAPPPKPDTPLRRSQIERSRSANLMTIQEWTTGFVDYLTKDGELPAEEVATLQTSAMLAPHFVRRALRERPTDNTDLIDALQETPFLLISGSEDVAAKPEDMQRVSELLNDSLLVPYEGVGSLTYWYHADAFNADIAGFFQTHLGR